MKVFKRAVRATEANLLEKSEFVFSNGGMTDTITLSKSRASIHTYPEKKACFVDLVTQEDATQFGQLDQAFRSYLVPRHASHRVVIRTQANH